MVNRSLQNDRLHAGSFFIAAGTILLFAGKDPGLGIANNHAFFTAAILLNLLEFFLEGRNDFRLDPVLTAAIVGIVALDISHVAFGSFDRGAMISVLFCLMLLLSVIIDGYSSRDVNVIANGTVIAAGLFTFLILFSGRELYAGAGKYVFVQKFGDHRVIEPNYMAALMTLGFCLCVYQLIGPLKVMHSIPSKAFYVVGAGIILFGIMLSGSRSALVSVFLFGLVILLLTDNRKVKRGLLVLGCAGAVLLVVMIVSGAIPVSAYTRMFQKSYLDESNSIRIRDWMYGIRLIMNRPLTGNGPAMTADLIFEKYAYIGDAHNTFITFGVMYGVLVLGVLVFLLFRMIWTAYVKRDTVMVALMIAMIFEWNIIACQFTVSTWITVLICMVMARTKEVYDTYLSKEKDQDSGIAGRTIA